MLIIAVVFCECNSILFALFMNDGEKDYRTRITGSTGSLKVERWKGEMVERSVQKGLRGEVVIMKE